MTTLFDGEWTCCCGMKARGIEMYRTHITACHKNPTNAQTNSVSSGQEGLLRTPAKDPAPQQEPIAFYQTVQAKGDQQSVEDATCSADHSGDALGYYGGKYRGIFDQEEFAAEAERLYVGYARKRGCQFCGTWDDRLHKFSSCKNS